MWLQYYPVVFGRLSLFGGLFRISALRWVGGLFFKMVESLSVPEPGNSSTANTLAGENLAQVYLILP
jgi:hypothetical protein